MRFTTALALAALGLFLVQAQADEPKKADSATLLGDYEIVGGERGGKELTADRLKEVKVRIAANAITTYDRDKKEVYAASYALDSEQRPWHITMTATLTPADDGKGAKAEGLIEMKGDTVRLIYALPGGKAPTQFKTGEKQQMFVLKRTGK
jgi:uncharacterized protein (TIGR03067 family)